MIGQEIIATLMGQRRIGPKDFFGRGQAPRLISARRAAIVRLDRAGIKPKEIARIVQRDYSTVRYWLRPDYRAHRTAYAAERRSAAQVAA